MKRHRMLAILVILSGCLLIGNSIYRITENKEEIESNTSLHMEEDLENKERKADEKQQIYSLAQASTDEISPTPIPMQTSISEPTPVSKGDVLERSYPSHRDFPYGSMEFVDDQAYAFLKEIYDEIDFYGEFELGEADLYDEYIAQYKKLVENEITFTVTETGEKYYLKEYKSMKVYGDETFDPNDFVYYLFDMDGDGAPELCIWDLYSYIFKYDIHSGDMVLWHEIETYWEQILGTRKLWWGWEGMRYTMVELDDDGNLEMGVYFLREAYWSNGNETYLITVPIYADGCKQIDLPEEMKQQAYFSEDSQVYMFNVTEEQFYELTGDFFEACKLSEESLKKVSYNYGDLFGEGNMKLGN